MSDDQTSGTDFGLAGDGKQFNDLPVEVIDNIFRFLPYPYSQDAFLVSKLWHSVASQNEHILDQEKVVCQKEYHDEFLATFLQSNRGILHLRLKGGLHYSPYFWTDCPVFHNDQFWKKYGSKLRSLSIYHCQFKRSDLFKILFRTPKLKTLKIKDCALESEDVNTNLKQTPDLSSLEKLLIYDEFGIPYNDLYSILLSNAQNLKSLHVKHYEKNTGAYLDCQDSENPYFSPNHVIQFMQQNAYRIDDLKFEYLLRDTDRHVYEILKIPNLKLRRLVLNRGFPDDLATNLKSLQYLELKLNPTCHFNSLKAILEKLEDLQCLKVDFLNANAAAYEFVSLQNITSLTLNTIGAEKMDIDLVMNRGLWSETKTDLKTLGLFGNYSLYVVGRLIQTHRGLTELSLVNNCRITDEFVQSNFSVLVNLHSLDLSGCIILTDAGLNENSLGRLQNLSKLYLNECISIKGTFFRRLVLPKLRHVEIRYTSVDQENLKFLLKNHPTIEVLSINNDALFTEEIVEVIVKTSGRLKCVYVDSAQEVAERCRTVLQRHRRLVRFLSVKGAN